MVPSGDGGAVTSISKSAATMCTTLMCDAGCLGCMDKTSEGNGGQCLEEEKKVKELIDAKNGRPDSASSYSALKDKWKCHVNDGSMTTMMVSFDVFLVH